MSTGPTPFSTRVRERKAAWWGRNAPLRARLHRLRELTRTITAADPPEVWRCCERWQRTLSNKLSGREWARSLGCRVPEIYWVGRCASRIPWERIPPQFVLKPLWGGGGRGAYVMSAGRERLQRVAMSREGLIRRLRPYRRPVRWIPLLVEEHVRRPDGTYGFALEFRFHVFRDVVAAVSIANERKQVSCYTEDWRPLEHTLFEGRQLVETPRPDGLEEMRATALRLGAAYGDYCRVDLFWTDRGVAFNELAATPLDGRGYSAFADDLLGRHWEAMERRFGGST